MRANPLKAQAVALVARLEQDRAGQTLMLCKVVKTLNTTPVILNAAPELHAAFVEEVVDIFVQKGTTPQKERWAPEWFRDPNLPLVSAEVVRIVLRRHLPFTDDTLAGMFEKPSGMNYPWMVPFRESFALALEKHAKKNGISPHLRKAAAYYADVLVVRHVPPKEVEFWKNT